MEHQKAAQHEESVLLLSANGTAYPNSQIACLYHLKLSIRWYNSSKMSIILPKLIPAMFNGGIKGSVYVGVIDSYSHAPVSF